MCNDNATCLVLRTVHAREHVTIIPRSHLHVHVRVIFLWFR